MARIRPSTDRQLTATYMSGRINANELYGHGEVYNT